MKSEKHKDGAYHFQSLLSWERGLKSKLAVYLNISVIVAPLVGAWIEINAYKWQRIPPDGSLLSWERGLKYSHHAGLV